MNSNIAMRYLHGLVKNKKISSNLWLKPHQLPSDVRKYAEVIYALLKEGSHMTPEIVIVKLADAVGMSDAELFVAAAMESKVTPAQVREMHSYILDKFIKERAQKVLEGFLVDMDKRGALDGALEELRELKAMQPTKQVSLGRQMAGAVQEAFDGTKNLIRYGFPTMDRRLGGSTRGEITLLAARPGHGKTSYTVQLVMNWSKLGYKVVFFSLEMPTAKLIHKMMSNESRITGHKLRTGRMSDAEKERLTKTAEDFVLKFKDNLLLYDDVYTVREMETIIAKHKPDVVVVDFIQLVQMDQSAMRTEIFKVMTQFKRMAKEYYLNMFCLSQLNRNVESRDDPIPRLSDLAESGALEQLSADVAFLWYAHKLDEDAPANMVDIYFQKTRYGELSHFRQLFDGSVMTYSERQADARQIDMEDQIEQQREEADNDGQRDDQAEGEAAG